MRTLTVFYDADCGVCTRFRRWMVKEPAYVELIFLPYDSRRALELVPSLPERGADREIVVMADDGRLWQGAGAWVTCLWTLRRWRKWARRLASPALLPLAAKVCGLVSANRLSLSRLLHLESDREVVGAVERMEVDCTDDRCRFERAKSLARGREER